MALLDKVPGELQLYIGGLFTLRRREALHSSGITHVLSVLRLPLDDKLFESFQHKVVEVDDVDDENLLEHLPACVAFIQDGLNRGGGVLVHCAMGKSRSATAVCAYLIKRFGVTPEQALAQIRQSRPLCEPNDGFMHQLRLWHEMSAPEDVESAPIYQRWLYQREVEMSRACGQAPEADKIRFEDEHAHQEEAAAYQMKCKKCRRILATSTYVLPHQPRPGNATGTCAHYFMDPLSWMRPELEAARLEGRLECPKCKTNVGKYAWQGMQCSCGDWVVPGISLAKSRIDEGRKRPPGGGADGMGIRLPPSSSTGLARRPPGQENL